MLINQVIFAGNAGQDAVVKTSGSGTQYCNMSLCHTRKDKNGRENTTWATATVFGNLVQYASIVKKGDNVCVWGSLSISEKEDQNGNKKTYVSIIANQLMVGQKGQRPQQTAPQQQTRQTTQAFNQAPPPPFDDGGDFLF